ncbi:MAG TPA: hypothetical protein VD995_02835 [Azospirillum sp.]|nr:hypothetical protein [Azospirillum sp.]
MTAPRRFNVGDAVEGDGIDGVVTAVVDIGAAQQVLGVRTPAGPIVVGVTVTNEGADITLHPFLVGDAVELARMVTAGRDPRMPVALLQRILSAALLTATTADAGAPS